MRLFKFIGDITTSILVIAWHIIVFIFSVVICGIPLLLLVEWCFPDYIHVFNKEITAKTVINLVEDKKYNEAIWLIEKKEKSIQGFNSTDFYIIKTYELKAQMAVGNFKAAERCIEQMDSIRKESQVNGGVKNKIHCLHDLQRARLYFKMNNHTKVQKTCYNYYKNSIKYQKELEQFFYASDDNKDKAKDLSKEAVNQFRIMYLRSVTSLDYPKGSMLFKKEIDASRTDLYRQMSLYMNLSLCAMQVDSIQDVRWCFNYLKKSITANQQIIKQATPKALANFMVLASYLHEEKDAKMILPYLEDCMNESYGTEELDYHEAVACCIPYWDMNSEFEKTNDALENQSEFFTDMLSQNFLFYGEEQRENLYTMYRPILEASFAHLSQDGSDKAAIIAYNNVLFTKGLLLRSSEQILHAVEQSNDKSTKDLYKTLLDQKKKQMEYEALGGLVNKYNLLQLKKDIADTEDRLSSVCYQYRSVLTENKMSYRDIQQKLQENEACIEFVLDNNGIYYALIGRTDYKFPKVVQLTNNKDVTGPLTPDIYNDTKFSKNIWGDISKHLKGIKTIYYSPAGELHRISFDALPYEDSYLIDYYHMVMVSSTADIHASQNESYSTATIMGDVRYSATDSLMLADATSNHKSVERHNFLMPLGDDETSDIFQMLNNKGVITNFYTRLDASEDNLKSLSGKTTDIIHLSTHGFYDPKYSTNPMKNSGLFLAGANRRWYFNENVKTKEDGIVTADEITTINLSGCRLVVLSACETGLGNIDNSEGVFGLQRAFKLAGVQSLMMSLWKVDNEATTLLMTTFYREWLSTGNMDKAFKKAKQIVRDEYHDPYYWAGFVLLDTNGI